MVSAGLPYSVKGSDSRYCIGGDDRTLHRDRETHIEASKGRLRPQRDKPSTAKPPGRELLCSRFATPRSSSRCGKGFRARWRSSHHSTGSTIRDPGNSKMARYRARFATFRRREARGAWPRVRLKTLIEQSCCLVVLSASDSLPRLSGRTRRPRWTIQSARRPSNRPSAAIVFLCVSSSNAALRRETSYATARARRMPMI